MKWQALENENGYCRLSIEADWSEIAVDYKNIRASYAKARLPGFRSGKLPQRVIEQRFSKEISADLSNLVVQRFGREAVRAAGTKALGSLEVYEIECAKEQTFRARVRFSPMPEIVLPELAGLLTTDNESDPRDRIAQRLLELVLFDVPDAMVRKELEREGLDECDPGNEVWAAAADRIRLLVILKTIARQEGITVDETDVNKRIAVKAKEFGTTTKSLQAELAEGGGIGQLKDMLLAESTLGYLLEINP